MTQTPQGHRPGRNGFWWPVQTSPRGAEELQGEAEGSNPALLLSRRASTALCLGFHVCEMGTVRGSASQSH